MVGCLTRNVGYADSVLCDQLDDQIECTSKYVISAAHADLQGGVASVHHLDDMSAYRTIDASAVEDEEAEWLDAVSAVKPS